MMVEFEDLQGRKVCVPHEKIISVYEASATSRWHGVRATVKVVGYKYEIESREDAQTISGRYWKAWAAARGLEDK